MVMKTIESSAFRDNGAVLRSEVPVEQTFEFFTGPLRALEIAKNRRAVSRCGKTLARRLALQIIQAYRAKIPNV